MCCGGPSGSRSRLAWAGARGGGVSWPVRLGNFGDMMAFFFQHLGWTLGPFPLPMAVENSVMLAVSAFRLRGCHRHY